MDKNYISDKPLLWIGALILLSYTSLAFAQSSTDNVIDISNPSSSDYIDITIQQAGYGQEINFSIGGSGNIIDINQESNGAYVGYASIWGSGYNWGGDIDGNDNNLKIVQTCNQSPCGGDKFEFHILGDNNDVDFYQGYHVTSAGVVLPIDDYEYGGHFVRLDIHGSNNTFLGSQRANDSGHEHTNTTYIYGDYNDVYTRQENNVDKSLSLTIYNDYNNVDMIQVGNAAHNATVTLTGSYATTLYMLQQGGTAQTYSLSQDCQTAGGCSISITQGQ